MYGSRHFLDEVAAPRESSHLRASPSGTIGQTKPSNATEFPSPNRDQWGGSPDPRRTPSSGLSSFQQIRKADQGVGRGRGRPPYFRRIIRSLWEGGQRG